MLTRSAKLNHNYQLPLGTDCDDLDIVDLIKYKHKESLILNQVAIFLPSDFRNRPTSEGTEVRAKTDRL